MPQRYDSCLPGHCMICGIGPELDCDHVGLRVAGDIYSEMFGVKSRERKPRRTGKSPGLGAPYGVGFEEKIVCRIGGPEFQPGYHGTVTGRVPSREPLMHNLPKEEKYVEQPEAGNPNRMFSANDRQVGGSHYAGKVQHWDLIERHGIGYLEGCASKYVVRCKLKNGLQDLEKAVHYIDKLLEMYDAGIRIPRGVCPAHVVGDFCRDHELDQTQMSALVHLLGWNCRAHLEMAKQEVLELIDAAKAGLLS